MPRSMEPMQPPLMDPITMDMNSAIVMAGFSLYEMGRSTTIRVLLPSPGIAPRMTPARDPRTT